MSIEYTGGDTWSENLVLFDYNLVPTQCNYSQAIGPSICKSIRARGVAVPHDFYINLHLVNSYVQINFTTHGEPLTNLQLFSCQTTGHGRIDVVLNNVTIAESYNKTSVWGWDWILHELNPAQHKHTHNYVLDIFKDRKTVSYGHFWLRRIRLETTVVHHRHGKWIVERFFFLFNKFHWKLLKVLFFYLMNSLFHALHSTSYTGIRSCKKNNTQGRMDWGVCCINGTQFSSLLLSIDQTNSVYSNDDQGRVCQSCKFHETLLLGIGHTKWITMSKEFDDPHVCDPGLRKGC